MERMDAGQMEEKDRRQHLCMVEGRNKKDHANRQHIFSVQESNLVVGAVNVCVQLKILFNSNQFQAAMSC